MDYTFIDASQNLEQAAEREQSGDKKGKVEPDFRFRDDAKINNKFRHKSKMASGHSMQGHSPVYE